MNKSRWKLNRGGFFNFWKHEETVFIFEDGKMLFHGANGSGKTMSMTSLITPVLDGKTSPERLDPFESKSRKMRDVLLGKQNAPLTDSRIGYMYLEYRKGNTNQYMTTIVGLEAVINRVTPNFWGCFLLNNRRIGIGFNPLYLYKAEEVNGRSVKVPLSKKKLQEDVGDSGFVVNSNEEYMFHVNKYLFGFATNQKFQDFIKLLIQLRTPKLSSAKTSSIKPSTLNEILRDSLPEITMEDLRPLVETIETIDHIKKDMDQQKLDRGLLKGIATPYDVYNDLLIYIKARNLLDADRRVHTQKTKEQEIKSHIKVIEEELERTEADISKLELRFKATEETIQSLQSNPDIFSLQKEQAKLVNERKEHEEIVNIRKSKYKNSQEQLKKYQEQVTEFENDIFITQSSIDEEMDELTLCADHSGFTQHSYLADFYIQNYTNTTFNFTEWNEAAVYQEWLLKEAAEMAKELDKVRETRSTIKNGLEVLETERKEAVKQRTIIEKEYEKKLNTFLDDLNIWVENLQCLSLSEDDSNNLIKLTESLFFTVEEDELTKFLAEKVEATLEKLRKKLLDIHLRKNGKILELTQINNEIGYWESGNGPEPSISEEKIEIRKKLLQEGVQFLPFYKAVEFFSEGISQETKARIESAIIEAGLLDALIVEKESEDYVGSLTVVIKTNQMRESHNLTKYLAVADSALLLKDQIMKVLAGISIEETAAGFILESGQFSSGFISGQAPNKESRYLGEHARIQYRKRLLKELHENKNQLHAEVTVVNKEIHQLEMELNLVKDERDQFPSYKHLKSLKADIDLKNQWIKEHIDKKIMQQQGELTKINDEISIFEDKMKVKLKNTSFRAETSYSVFEQCLAFVSEYKTRLNTLEHLTATYYSSTNHMNHMKEWIESLYEEIDSIRAEIKQFEDKIVKSSMLSESIEKQLEANGAEEITAQLNEQLELKIKIPVQINQLRKTETNLKIGINELTKSVIEIQTKLPFAHHVFALTEDLFTKDPIFHIYRWGEKDIVQQAKEIEKQLKEKHRIDSNDLQKRINDLDIRINSVYNQAFKTIKSYQANLERVTNEKLNSLPFSLEELTEDQAALVGNILRYETRIVVTMSCIEHGIELEYSPTPAIDKVEADIQIQELRMSEKDRQLYENFLLQDLRKIIRDRIGDVDYWITEMNLIMGEVRTSSKLSLKIKWVPISGDTEEELHTRKLVKLFSIDSAILNEDEKEQVINHFRSKITRKLQLAELNGERIRTFKEVIHEVFDYRTWFNFEIHATLKDDDLGHLTNKVYYGLSGGEKALSMYIPLLAAVYSRYSEASADCPRMITLDEAFAGVDDNNISEIFGMLKQMDFDYIYNSQSLWGCYPTVPALAIYDFQNTEDSDDVILFRYRWNGFTKEYLGPVKPANEHSSQLSFPHLLEFELTEDKTDEQSS